MAFALGEVDAGFTLEVWILHVGILATVAILTLAKLEEMAWPADSVLVDTLLLRIMQANSLFPSHVAA